MLYSLGTLFIPMVWDLFIKSLYESIQKIDIEYFSVTRNNEKTPNIWRERAYCYELYHQLRYYIPSYDFPDYKLHGELDKKGDELCGCFKKYGWKGCPNPDFVVHVPGKDKNLVVMEVKSISSIENAKTGIEIAKRDIRKLEIFIDKCDAKKRYEHGIFLIFGSDDYPEVHESIYKLKVKDELRPNGRLCILWHKEVGKAPDTIDGISHLDSS